MADLSSVNLDNVKPQEAFEALPSGSYKAMITESEVKKTKGNDGEFLSLKIEIVDGEFKNRKLFDNLNLWNKSEKAVEIATRSLKSIEVAVGLTEKLKRSEQLHNKPMVIVVGQEQYNGETKNKIKGYKSLVDFVEPAKAAPKVGGSGVVPAWRK